MPAEHSILSDVFTACRNAEVDDLREILAKHRQELGEGLLDKEDEHSEYHDTPLTYCCRQKGGEAALMVRLLLGESELKVDTTSDSSGADVAGEKRMAMKRRGSARLDKTIKLGRTPLLVAAGSGNAEVIEVLLEYGAGALVDQAREDGVTALFVAAGNGFSDCVKQLLGAGADKNLVNANGATPVLAASQNGFHEVVAILIERGVDVNIPRKDGATPLKMAAVNGHANIVNMLIAAGADINNGLNTFDTPMVAACLNGHDKVVSYLLEAGAQVLGSNANGFTTLMLAAQSGNEKIVKLLIEAIRKVGVDQMYDFLDTINEQDGSTALCYAAAGGFDRVIGELMKAGAKCSIFDAKNETPLYIAAINGHHKAVAKLAYIDAEVNTRILYANSGIADIPATDGLTALLIASQKGFDKVVNYLMIVNASVNCTDKNGCSALWLASQNGHDKVVTLLMTSKDLNVDLADNQGSTPLFMAAQNGHRKVATLLLAAKAKHDVPNKSGVTPLDVATKNKNEKMIKLLKAPNVVVTDSLKTLFEACKEGNVDAANNIIQRDFANKHGDPLLAGVIDLFDQESEAEDTALSYCCKLDKSKFTEAAALARLLLTPMQKGGAGADVGSSIDMDRTPLFLAAGMGNEQLVDVLMEFGAGAQVNKARDDGCTPLFIAAHNGHGKIVSKLLDAGANKDAVEGNGCTALFAASLGGYEEIVSILIAAGANVDIANKEGVTPLYVAALNGFQSISSLLVAAMADPNITRVDGTSPLFKAATVGKLQIVMDLISAGALVDAANTDGATPIFMAAHYGYNNIVSYLLSSGADASIEGKAPDYPYKVTPLEIAHAKDHDRIYAILSKHGHEIAKDGVYALKWAAIRGNQAELSRLLSIDHINKDKDTFDPKEFGGRNALMLASYFGRTQCVSALLAAGCDMTLNAPSATDKIGSDAASPIVFAALGGSLECVKLLLDKGAALEKAGKGRKGKK